MAKLVVGALLLLVAFLIRLAGVAAGGSSGRASGIVRAVSFGFVGLGIALRLFSTGAVILNIGDLRKNLQQH